MSRSSSRSFAKSNVRAKRYRSNERSASQSNRRRWQAGEEMSLTIDAMASDGHGIARLDGQVVFVKGALPSEQCRVQLEQRKRKIWYGRTIETTSSSADRVEPECQHYAKCGGCDLQHLAYQAQVQFKQQRVIREFKNHHIDIAQWAPALTSDAWHYRRKARVGVRYSAQQQQHYIGFRESGNSHLSDIDQCPVLIDHPVLEWQRWHSVLQQLSIYDKLTHIDVTVADNALALSLRVLRPLKTADEDQLLDFINRQVAQQDVLPVQIWQQTEKAQPAQAIATCCPIGGIDRSQPDELFHSVGELSLQVRLDDFLQINGAINRAMVRQAIDWLALTDHDHVVDLFAGHGNFSLPLAQQGCRVTAVEVQPRMIDALTQQAQKLALPLLTVETDLSAGLPQKDLQGVDAVLLDPPRAGAWQVVNDLAGVAVAKVVYVACDPATMARDVKHLLEHGYSITRAGIMDMFPQTHHVETMMLLEYKG